MNQLRIQRYTFVLTLIVLIGIALRLWMIWVSPLDPRFSNADDGDFYRRALRLAVTGQYIDDFWLIRPPLHVFFYAFWLWLALVWNTPQSGLLFIQLAQVGLSVITILAGYGSARRMFQNTRAGLLFAAFLACWYPFVEQPTVLFSELMYLALFSIHLWLLVRSDQTHSWRDLLLSGVALGAAALTRSPALYSLAFVALWLGVREMHNHASTTGSRFSPGTLRVAFRFSLIAVGCLAIVLPWTARNYVVYQKIIPVDTLGQINLWLDLDKVSMRNANIDTLRGMPQAERAGFAMARAREILAADPFKPFESMWPTFQHIWKAQFIEDFYLKQSFFTRPLRETAWLGLAGDAIWLVFMLAGLLGLAGPLREGLHRRLFMLAWLGYSLLTVLVFHVEPRYLLPIWMLIGLYGAGVLGRAGRGATGADTPVRPDMLILQLVVAGVFVWLLLSYRDYGRIILNGMAREQGYVAGETAYRQNAYAAAERGFRAALLAQPGFVDAQVGLALAVGAQGRVAEAQAILVRGSSRRAELVYGALARAAGDAITAAEQLARYEAIAGEDVQTWALEWFRPPPTQSVAVGNGLDLGYLQGFLEAEQSEAGGYRWLSGDGTLVVPLGKPIQAGDLVLLRLTSGLPTPTTLRVQIGNGPVQQIEVQSGAWRSYRFSIPVELVGGTKLTIRLSAATLVPALVLPGSNDARALSLMVSEVRVQ